MPHDIKAILRDADRTSFPSGTDYHARFIALEGYMNEHVHKDVVLGAIAVDGGLLNDHGPNHIKTVIARAGCMLSGNRPMAAKFTPYEIYLLLCAAHFHDVGNVFGRRDHEQRHQDVMRELRPLLGNDALEMQCILRISAAHGGHIEGDRDKIGSLEDYPVNGLDVRVRALAAVLRFADELADDRQRANRFLLEHDRLPKEAEVFHKYAACLDSVMVRTDDGCIDLHYSLTTADATRQWGKNDGNGGADEVYIVDEIYARTLKMHLERSYCSRFMRPFVDIERIKVMIEIFDELASIDPPRKKIEYRLEECGYPSVPANGIQAVCRELKTGHELAQLFSAGTD